MFVFVLSLMMVVFVAVVFRVVMRLVLVFVMRMGMGMNRAVGMSVTVGVFLFMLVLRRMFVAMVMIMREVNVEFHTFDAGLFPARDVQVVAIKPQFSQFLFQPARIHAQVNQCADQHVAADPAKNVQIKCLHPASPLIWLAAYPAPKPLSIFTTVTPLPQLFNMPSKAAIPPKLAP